MAATEALEAVVSLPGYAVKTGDAKGAYRQALLRGAETWVTLPENRWPKHWKGKFHRLVVRLNFGPLRPCRRRRLLGSPLRGKALVHRMGTPCRGMAGRLLAQEDELDDDRLCRRLQVSRLTRRA